MLQSLGDLLPYAVPVALSPLPVIAMVVLLLAPAGTRGGYAFLAGRVATLAVIAFAMALLAGRLAAGLDGADRGGWLRISLGSLLIVAAIVTWRRRPAKPAMPAWMRALDRASPAQALRLGGMLTVVNPKELAFVAGAGTIIGGAPLSAGAAFALALVFAAIAGIGVAVPLVWALVAGPGVRGRLAGLRDRLVRNQAAMIAVVLLLIGAMLIGSGLESL